MFVFLIKSFVLNNFMFRETWNTAIFAIFEYTKNIALKLDQFFCEIIILTWILIEYLIIFMELIALLYSSLQLPIVFLQIHIKDCILFWSFIKKGSLEDIVFQRSNFSFVSGLQQIVETANYKNHLYALRAVSYFRKRKGDFP